MKRITGMVFLMIIVLLTVISAGAEDQQSFSNLATEENVIKTAERAFDSSWMPQNVRITISQENGSWIILATDKNSNDQLAEMRIDGDNEDCIVYYRLTSYHMPLLNNISGEVSFNDKNTPAASWNEWAEEIYHTYRGSFGSTGRIICTVELEDHSWLYGFGTQGETDAILFAKASGNPKDYPVLLAYVDFSCNWEVHHERYISLGDAFNCAVDACIQHWDGLTLEDPLVLGGSAFVLFDSYSYFDQELIEPLWLIVVEDQRADPSLEMFNPLIKHHRYPVLINPENGEIVQFLEPEDFGQG